MSHRRVVLGVTGSIAAYKAAEIVRHFTKSGVDVHCIMTKSATEFLHPTTLATLSENPVTVELFGPPAGSAASYGDSGPVGTGGSGTVDSGSASSPANSSASSPLLSGSARNVSDSGEAMEGTDPSLAPSSSAPSSIDHIRASREADLIVVAPATANVLGKVANGIADDALTTTLLATSIPVLYAPAMNTRMWEHPAVQNNVRVLAERGALFVPPGEGELACGEYGAGRMGEPFDIVGAAIRAIDGFRPGTPRMLITAGGTEEEIDPVRVVSNRSSGRMGFAIAEAARDAGYRVTVIAARTTAPRPLGVYWIDVRSAAEMQKAVLAEHTSHDVLVMAAAVSDYRPKKKAKSKISSGAASLLLEMESTTDILKTVAKKRRGMFTVGFALQTDRQASRRLEAARAKLERKGVQMLVLNNPMQPGSEFGGETNEVTFLMEDGRVLSQPLQTKYEVGVALVRAATEFLRNKHASEAVEPPSKNGANGTARKVANSAARKVARKTAASKEGGARKGTKRKSVPTSKKVIRRKSPTSRRSGGRS